MNINKPDVRTMTIKYAPKLLLITILIMVTISVASMAFQNTVLVLESNSSKDNSIYANIRDYIRREPWMKPGGVVKVPLMADPGTLNPFTAVSSWDFMIIDLVYDPLVTLTPDLKYVGRLAKSWNVSPDGLVWTFTIFENATWHDGKPVTAEDVKFTYDLFLKIGKLTRLADVVDIINHTEVVNKYTVKIYLNKPFAPFLYRIAQELYIVPKHIWENITEPEKFKNEHPIGSGPFKFVEGKTGQYYRLKAFDKYHLGRPLIDGILFPVITNPDAMLLAFKRGEIDVMTWTVPYVSVPELEKIPGVKIHKVTETGARFLVFNCQRWPMSDKRFRQAVHHVLNLTEVVKVVYQGYAIPGSLGRIPPILKPWYNENLPTKEEKYPYDLDKAAKLLDEMGFIDRDGDGWRDKPDGTPIELVMYSPAYDPNRVRWGDMIKEGLEKIGVKVKHQPLEWTTLVSKIQSGDFDMLIIGGIGGLDPDVLYSIYHSKGGWNQQMERYSNPELDKLLEEQRFTVDPKKRIEIVWKIQEILAEEVPLFNVVHQQFVFAYRTDRFDGWVVGPFTAPDNFFSYMNLYNVKLAGKPTTTTTTATTIATPTTIVVTVPVTTTVPTTATTTIPGTITTITVTTTAPGTTTTVTTTVTATTTITTGNTGLALGLLVVGIIIGFAVGFAVARRKH